MRNQDYSYYQAESLLSDWHKSNIDLARAVLVAGNYDDKSKRLADRIKSCRDWVDTRIEPGTLLPKVYRANCCEHRLCKYCASKKSRHDRHGLYATLSEMYVRGDFEKYDFFKVTLTWPNCEFKNLRQSFRNANDNFRAMTSVLKSGHGTGFIVGTFRSIEFTIGKSDPNKFHPHMHCLFAVEKSCDDFANSVYCDRIRDYWASFYPEKIALNLQGKFTDDIEPFVFDLFNTENNGLGDFCKYILKLSDVYQLSSDRLAEVLPHCTTGVRGLQACSYGGIFRDAHSTAVKNGFDYYDLESYGFQDGSFYERLKDDANFIQFEELKRQVDLTDVVFAQELYKPINTPNTGFSPMQHESNEKYCTSTGDAGMLQSFSCVRSFERVGYTSEYKLSIKPGQIPSYELVFHGGDPYCTPSFKVSFLKWFADYYSKCDGVLKLDRQTMKLAYDYVMSDFWVYNPYTSQPLQYDGGVWIVPSCTYRSTYDSVMDWISHVISENELKKVQDHMEFRYSSLGSI